MGQESADSVRQSLTDKLGPEGGTFAWHIRNEVLQLVRVWDFQLALFGTNTERFDLFKEVSSKTAFFVQDVLWDSAILRVSRLTDPPYANNSKKTPNLSVKSLARFVPEPDRQDYQKLVDEVCKKVDTSSRIWRSKRIAHLDLHYTEHPAELPQLSRKVMTDAVEGLQTCLKVFLKVAVGWEGPMRAIEGLAGDEIAFLTILQLGLTANKERDARWRKLMDAGKYDEAKAVYDIPDWLGFRPSHKWWDE